MVQQFTIGEPDVRNASLPSYMHAAWARYPRLDITWHILENQNFISEQASHKPLYLLDIERVRLLNNPRVGCAFVASQRSLFLFTTSFQCDFFGVATSFKAWFVDVLAQWPIAREIHGVILAFINVVELWGDKVFTNNTYMVVHNYYYEHVVANGLGLAIGTEKMQVLMWERTIAAWEQLKLS